MKQVVQLKCPVCQTPATIEVETRLNTAIQPHLKRQLLNNELQQFCCEECGARRQIETNFLYHDPTQKFMVFLIPNLKQKKEQVNQLLANVEREENVDLADYELRVVSHHPDLIEKIQLFENHYNDREVEIVKLLTDGLFGKEKPEEKVRARYFYMKDQSPKIMYITENDQLLVDFSDSLLRFAQDKFKKLVDQGPKGEFQLIDAQWAALVLTDN